MTPDKIITVTIEVFPSCGDFGYRILSNGIEVEVSRVDCFGNWLKTPAKALFRGLKRAVKAWTI